MAVHTVLVSGGSSGSSAKAEVAKPRASAGKVSAEGGKADVVRVASRELVYSDEARKAEFTGGVEVREQGRQHAGAAGRGLSAVAQKDGAGKASLNGGAGDGRKTNAAPVTGGIGFMGGSVERMVATGHIEMQQPGTARDRGAVGVHRERWHVMF